MMCIQQRSLSALLGLGAICSVASVVGMSGCEQARVPAAPVGAASSALTLDELASQCGYACPGSKDADGVTVKGLDEGNASISGVPAVDGFFTSVIHYQTAAKSVAAGIDAQLSAIRVDFQLPDDGDIGDQLGSKLASNLQAGFRMEVEPAVCKADIQAELTAAARCDASVSGGKVEVDCKGGCDVEASADLRCDASADLRCTVNAPEIDCHGECNGSCRAQLDVAARCEGTCSGTCTGNCSSYQDQAGTVCQGSCDGMCKGSCDVEATASATCEGKCQGECTQTRAANAGCEGGVRAQCKAKANASIKCDTKCDADFEPPMVKADCQAKVQAEAKMSVQCTPPRAVFHYSLRTELVGDERVRFESALRALIDVRLPALKAALKKSDSVGEAGVGLSAAAGGGVGELVKNPPSNIDVKVAFGLGCAAEELGKVKSIIDASTETLDRSVQAASKINSALKIQS